MSAITATIGCLLLSVAIVGSVPDVAYAIEVYRIFSASCGAGVAIFIGAAYLLVTRFITLINVTVERAKSSSSRERSFMEVKAIARRFSKGKCLLLMVAPLGVGAWVIQIAVIPLFWYLALLHIMNVWFACVIIWFSIIPQGKKRRIMNTVRCGVILI